MRTGSLARRGQFVASAPSASGTGHAAGYAIRDVLDQVQLLRPRA